MDKVWLSENLDFRILTFKCVPTGHLHGLMEMITDAQTLRQIQISQGGTQYASYHDPPNNSEPLLSSVMSDLSNTATASFKDTSIYAYLEKCNSYSQLDFNRSLDNFTRSTAGYCIISYILGLCDRHNDNIMIRDKGHLFHIDFGKFLGDAQRLGNLIKRDRVPFILTPDMVYVIERNRSSGSDQVSGFSEGRSFHNFVDLCCEGFNVIRKHGNLLLNLFALMASSGIPGVNMDAVRYVQRALHLDLSDGEAASTFTRLIEESMSSWAAQLNFLIHNLAQMRFTHGQQSTKVEQSVDNSSNLLSFVPGVYCEHSDGRILEVRVQDIQKRYVPTKHYVFILRVVRVKADISLVFRTYNEFCELDAKLNVEYLQKYKGKNVSEFERPTRYKRLRCSSSGNPTDMLGRTEVKQIATHRKHHISQFLQSLFSVENNAELAHCDLVYTFFHPLLRDQEECDVAQQDSETATSVALAGSSQNSSTPTFHHNVESFTTRRLGELKLSICFQHSHLTTDANDTLNIMVHHARDLFVPQFPSHSPNTYVKIYLLPDPKKVTKRKTKIVKKNKHPSFMEVFEYSNLDAWSLKNKTLFATVWSVSSGFGALTSSSNSGISLSESRSHSKAVPNLIGSISIPLTQFIEHDLCKDASSSSEGVWYRLTSEDSGRVSSSIKPVCIEKPTLSHIYDVN